MEYRKDYSHVLIGAATIFILAPLPTAAWAQNDQLKAAERKYAEELAERQRLEKQLSFQIEKSENAAAHLALLRAAQKEMVEADNAVLAARAAVAVAKPEAPKAPAGDGISPNDLRQNSPICRIFGDTPTLLAQVYDRQRAARGTDNPLNRFSVDCLGLAERSQYDVVSLNGQLQATNTTSTVEVVPSYSRYYRTAIDGDDVAQDERRVRASYHRIRLGTSIPLDKGGKSATFADLSQPGFASEVGIIAGYEYGRVRVRQSELTTLAQNSFAKARQNCLQNYLTTPRAEPFTEHGKLVPEFASADPRTVCDGVGLSDFMAKDGNAYYTSIVAPQWRPRTDPTLYFGIEGRFARAKRSFFPLSDPAGTGTPVLVDLPAGYPSGASTVGADLFAVKLYGGTSFLLYSRDTPPGSVGRPKEASLGTSLTYRRDLQFAAGTRDQAVCPGTNANFFSCPTINTARPFVLEGFVAGVRAAVRIPRFFYLPEMGIEAKFTYAIDTEQVGLEVPVYVFADAEGKTNAGISLNCTNDGRTRQGYRLKGECKAAVFLGRTFSLAGKP